MKPLLALSLCVGCSVGIDSGTPNPTTPDASATTADAAAPDRFKGGDPFDYSLVTPQSQMVATMISGWGYAASTAPKAIAIDARGLGYVSIKPGAGDGDAERTALEGCYVIGGDQPCALLASGNSFAIDEHLLASSFSFTLVEPNGMPFVITSVRTTDLMAYMARTGFKSVAVSLDGVTSFTNSDDVMGTQAEADRVMLERCEMQAALTPCMLYAEGNTVVFDAAHPMAVAQIDFARTMVQTNLPGTTTSNFNKFVPAYTQAVAQGLFGAIYLGPRGQGGTDTGSVAATVRNTALAFCTQNLKPGDPACFPYATGRTITFTPSLMGAFLISADAHCLSMPRTDCAAHKLIGCPAGMYYTTHSGTVDLEACN